MLPPLLRLLLCPTLLQGPLRRLHDFLLDADLVHLLCTGHSVYPGELERVPLQWSVYPLTVFNPHSPTTRPRVQHIRVDQSQWRLFESLFLPGTHPDDETTEDPDGLMDRLNAVASLDLTSCHMIQMKVFNPSLLGVHN